MAWFRRGGKDSSAASDGGREATATRSEPSLAVDDEIPVQPVLEGVPEAERNRIARALEELGGAGVDVDDLSSLAAGLDDAFTGWESAPEDVREPHERIVERYALGIGEHLHRHTDLRWQVVTDAFGTDLAVAGGFRGDFVVVPSNLVAVRWLRRETGWVPGVVGHIVRLRSR